MVLINSDNALIQRKILGRKLYRSAGLGYPQGAEVVSCPLIILSKGEDGLVGVGEIRGIYIHNRSQTYYCCIFLEYLYGFGIKIKASVSGEHLVKYGI